MVKSLVLVIKRPKVFRIINTAALHSAYLKAVKDYIQPLMAIVALFVPVFVHHENEKRNGIIIGGIYFLIYLATSWASKYASKLESQIKFDVPFATLLFGFFLGAATGFFYTREMWVVALVAFIGIYLVENVRKPVLTGYISDFYLSAGFCFWPGSRYFWNRGFVCGDFGVAGRLFSSYLT
jgi:hypothetical protein